MSVIVLRLANFAVFKTKNGYSNQYLLFKTKTKTDIVICALIVLLLISSQLTVGGGYKMQQYIRILLKN